MDVHETGDRRSDRRLAAGLRGVRVRRPGVPRRDTHRADRLQPADMAAGGTEMEMATYTEEWTEIENETWSNDSSGSARSPRNTAWPSRPRPSSDDPPARSSSSRRNATSTESSRETPAGRHLPDPLDSVRGSVRSFEPIGTRSVLMTSPRPPLDVRPARSPWSVDGSTPA